MDEPTLHTIQADEEWTILARRITPHVVQVVATSRWRGEYSFPVVHDTLTTLQVILEDRVVGQCPTLDRTYRASEARRAQMDEAYQWVCPHCLQRLKPLDDFRFS